MKKLFVILASAALLLACTKTPQPTYTVADFTSHLQAFETTVNDPNLTEEGFNDAMNALLAFVDSVIADQPSDSLAIAILDELVWYLPLEQKAELYAAVDMAALSDKQLHYFHSFQAEERTAIGMPYTDFGALTPAGDSLYLHELIGQRPFLLIDFWATWCGPCRASLPAMKELYAEMGDRLQILGVSLDNDHDKWASFVEKEQLNWLHMSDLKAWECVPAQLYGVMAVPSTVLIDSTGTIVTRNASVEDLRIILQN